MEPSGEYIPAGAGPRFIRHMGRQGRDMVMSMGGTHSYCYTYDRHGPSPVLPRVYYGINRDCTSLYKYMYIKCMVKYMGVVHICEVRYSPPRSNGEKVLNYLRNIDSYLLSNHYNEGIHKLYDWDKRQRKVEIWGNDNWVKMYLPKWDRPGRITKQLG